MLLCVFLFEFHETQKCLFLTYEYLYVAWYVLRPKLKNLNDVSVLWVLRYQYDGRVPSHWLFCAIFHDTSTTVWDVVTVVRYSTGMYVKFCREFARSCVIWCKGVRDVQVVSNFFKALIHSHDHVGFMHGRVWSYWDV
jgi:hypothetical protein